MKETRPYTAPSVKGRSWLDSSLTYAQVRSSEEEKERLQRAYRQGLLMLTMPDSQGSHGKLTRRKMDQTNKLLRKWEGREDALFRKMANMKHNERNERNEHQKTVEMRRSKSIPTSLLSHKQLKKKQEDAGHRFTPHQFTYPSRSSKYAFLEKRLKQVQQIEDVNFSPASVPHMHDSFSGRHIREAQSRGRPVADSSLRRDWLAAGAISACFDDNSPANEFDGEQTFMGAGAVMRTFQVVRFCYTLQQNRICCVRTCIYKLHDLPHSQTRPPKVDEEALKKAEEEEKKKHKVETPEQLRQNFLDIFFEYPTHKLLEQNESMILVGQSALISDFVCKLEGYLFLSTFLLRMILWLFLSDSLRGNAAACSTATAAWSWAHVSHHTANTESCTNTSVVTVRYTSVSSTPFRL